MLGKIEGKRRRRQQRMWSLDDITDSIDMSLSKLREIVKDREAWCAADYGVTKHQTWLPLNNKNKKNASGTKSGDKIELKKQQLYLQWCWLGRTSYFRRTMCVEWRRQWHPTPVLLPGKSHGWRSLVGCSPWGHEESDTTEQFHFHFSLSCLGEGNGSPLQCSCLENPRQQSVVSSQYQ